VAAADKLPQVSVIIPVYNRADTLAMAVQSVLAQTFHDFEIIIIDDGSTDDLAGALTSFDDPRLRLLTHERRRVIPTALIIDLCAPNLSIRWT
jgi:glycosyltransferase involved in cell wall biosynthesis